MAGTGKIFKNIDQMRLSSSNLFIVAIALIGSVAAFATHQWLKMATSQEVDMVANPSSITFINPEDNEGVKRLDVDVVLVVDWSGSMNGEAGSDPQKLRLRASEVMASSLAADIFPRHTRMGYVQFAKTAVVVQDLIDVEDMNARVDMIQKIYNLSSEIPVDSDWTTLTNISDAFTTAGYMLDEAKLKNDPEFASNIPAIVFLTDGRPTNGLTSEEDVEIIVNDLLEKGTLIFVVILRNPDNPDPDLGFEPESPMNFSFWRSFWYHISSENPDQVKYFEANDDTQLEGIYNTIRSRLVKEGTTPSDRLEYDPSDPNATIEIPPGLLQAHLLVNRPVGVDSIELIAPDGLNFQEDILKDPENNEILDGNLFYRFSMYKPIPGGWTLSTDARQPLYYLLITESIYTAKPFASDGSLYLEPDRPTELPFVVVDDLNNIVNDAVFDLKASTLKTVQKEDGSYVEEAVILSTLERVTINNGETQYVLTVNPEMFEGEDSLQVQIDGVSDGGAPINLASYNIPVLPAPSGFEIIAPEKIVCDSDSLIFWPPAIQCSNQITIDAIVQNASLISEGTLNGKMYTPLDTEAIDMTLSGPSELQANLGPLTKVGNYQVVVDIGGKIDSLDGEFQWQKQGQKTIRVEWPTWVEPAKHRTWFAFVVLLVIALWKPVFVAILLPLFAILRIAPSGFYTDGDSQPIRIYDLAMKKRSLFALTIGSSTNADIKVYPPSEDNDESSFSSKLSGRLLRSIYRWLKSLPCARMVAMPWNGIWVEKPSGEFERASERSFTTINCQNVNVRIGQRDWEDEDLHL